MRKLITSAIAAVCVSGVASAATMDFNITPPRRAGTVFVQVRDFLGTGATVGVNVPITAADTAITKRNKIRDALAAQAAAQGVPWTFTNVAGPAVRVGNLPAKGVTGLFVPRGTGEYRDELYINGGCPENHPPRGKMGMEQSSASLYDENGLPATFTVGIKHNGVPIETTVSGDDARFNGQSSVSTHELMGILYNDLNPLVSGSGYGSLYWGPGNQYIDVNFAYSGSDESTGNGLIFGTTSTSDGLTGEGTYVPEPASLMLLSLAGLLIRRRGAA
ncbi:hypothetical protein RAS1_37760 [Phycisphaerae bacterium RAS1]|nr:hypothetical protein RAS1_37760 [Phycisphaerae bacterium RAS1]